jgi:methylated-DNA-[protein]-cysteine S-methyltransferase
MANELSYIVFETKRGWIGILASKAGLVSVTLPQRNRQQAVDAMGKQAQTAILSTDSFIELEYKFKHYYSGERTTFADKLDFSNATVFQRYVWEATRLIPYGETQSYGWVARQIGRPKAARAVGQALGKNPFIIIVPCHRVIAGDGKLGGFGGGRDMKKTLLELEKTPRKKS